MMKRYAYGWIMEARVDQPPRYAGGEQADGLIARIDRRYPRAKGHARPHGHGELGHE
ncbi:hypothetical protein [Sphingobium cloacae]|uniref:hypothetical protein n=1 Tax=Sphingobium cloacae TaxID=120107 RepID=UPI000AFAD3BE|nr:hypothetical protein [Sphingobium cloacae]